MIAGSVMSVLFILANFLGSKAIFVMYWGIPFGLLPGPAAWIVGFIVHLLVSGLIAEIYAAGFRLVKSGLLITGFLFSCVHLTIAGALLWFFPFFYPGFPDIVQGPGPFFVWYGVAGVYTFIGAHVMYGLIIAGFCGAAARSG